MRRIQSWLFVQILLGLFVIGAMAQPDIQFETRAYDFGTAYPNQRLVHQFAFKNAGNEPLIVDRVTTSCGCTAAVISSSTIPAGGEGIISVTMTVAAPGKMHKTSTVFSNDPNKPRMVLDVLADVRNLWSFSPRANFMFREIPYDTEQTQQLVLANVDGDTFKIVGHRTTRPEFKVSTSEQPGATATITLTMHTGHEKGLVADTLEIRTDHPRQPVIQVPIQAEVVGLIRFNRPRLYFGSVVAGSRITREVIATYPLDASYALEISKIEGNNKYIEGRVTGTVPGGGLKVEFAFTAPDSPGYFNGEIQLHTNVAVEPITTLPYSALVRNR